MAGTNDHSRQIWALAARQGGVVSLDQLRELGFGRHAIRHRIERGRLHRLWPGVYAVGRPRVSREAIWMAAVLACGDDAVLSHGSAAAMWGVRSERETTIHISVPVATRRRLPGIQAHRRRNLAPSEIDHRFGIPLTNPATTLVDLAACGTDAALDRAINEADRLGLIDPDALRGAIEAMPPRPGRGRLRKLLDRRTFLLTDSELERHFLPLARRADLPTPETGAWVNGFKVDFWWPSLGLVVETDGLRYHRTPAQQARDRRRDQAHTAAGHTHLRFVHAEIRDEPERVVTTLRSVARRLSHGR